MTITTLKKPLKILQLDNDSKTANEVITFLTSEGFKTEVTQINSRKQLIDKLQKNSYDLLFLSDNAQDCSGTDALKAVKKLKVYTPVLIFSDILEEETIVNYITLGAVDYILKTSLHRLVSIVRRIVINSRNSNIVDYQNFFESSPDLMCVCDREGHFIAINQAWGGLSGFTDAELIDKPFIQFVHPDDQKSAAAQFQKLFDAKSKSSDVVSRFQTAAGDTKWLHWKMKIQADGSIAAIVRDVTDSKTREVQLVQAHNNLQKLNELYKTDLVKKTLVADQIRDSVVVTDLKGNIVSWNKGSEKIFGYSPAETVGQHIAMIYPEKDYKFIQEEASNVLLEQGEKEFELHMRRKSGEVFEARLTLEVTRDSAGKVNGMLGYAIDMGPVRSNATENTSDGNSARPEVEQVADQPNAATQDVVAETSRENIQQPDQTEVANQLPEETPEEIVVVESQHSGAVEQGEMEEIVVGESADTGPTDRNEENLEDTESTQKIFVPAVTGSGLTIMYLEDSLKHIHQIEKILGQRQDYRLITTQEPEDCIDMARQYMPSLVMLDMDLPDVNGQDLLKQLRNDKALKNIPVIALGADTSSEAANNARESGFAEYLVKPVEEKPFLEVIDSIVYVDRSKVIGNAG